MPDSPSNQDQGGRGQEVYGGPANCQKCGSAIMAGGSCDECKGSLTAPEARQSEGDSVASAADGIQRDFTLGNLHNKRKFDLLRESTERMAPFDAVDLVALKAAAGDGCTFELETLDGAEFMRLYAMGLVSMTCEDEGWPHACITQPGIVVLSAAEVAQKIEASHEASIGEKEPDEATGLSRTGAQATPKPNSPAANPAPPHPTKGEK